MILYISGKYRGNVVSNIRESRKIAIELWEKGHVAISPHLNTAFFEHDCLLYNGEYIKGDLKIIARCDGLVMMPGWEESEGARIEHEYAVSNSIPVYYYPDIPSLHKTEKKYPLQCEEFISICMKMYRLHLSKNADYSSSNLLATGEIGLVTRLWDKIARLLTLAGFRFKIVDSYFIKPEKPNHESIDDTLMDSGVYSVIGQIMRKGLWGR